MGKPRTYDDLEELGAKKSVSTWLSGLAEGESRRGSLYRFARYVMWCQKERRKTGRPAGMGLGMPEWHQQDPNHARPNPKEILSSTVDTGTVSTYHKPRI